MCPSCYQAMKVDFTEFVLDTSKLHQCSNCKKFNKECHRLACALMSLEFAENPEEYNGACNEIVIWIDHLEEIIDDLVCDEDDCIMLKDKFIEIREKTERMCANIHRWVFPDGSQYKRVSYPKEKYYTFVKKDWNDSD